MNIRKELCTLASSEFLRQHFRPLLLLKSATCTLGKRFSHFSFPRVQPDIHRRHYLPFSLPKDYPAYVWRPAQHFWEAYPRLCTLGLQSTTKPLKWETLPRAILKCISPYKNMLEPITEPVEVTNQVCPDMSFHISE